MPKKKSYAFNSMQIKDGWIVRLYKDGRIKSAVAPYEPKHPKKNNEKIIEDNPLNEKEIIMFYTSQRLVEDFLQSI